MDRPTVVALDVLGTLFDEQGLRPRLERAGLPGELAELFMTRVLRDGFALEASGTFHPMDELAAAHARALLEEHGLDASKKAAREIADGLEELPLHVDARSGLDQLRERCVRTIALTNGGEETTRAMLDRVGYGKHFERIVSVRDVGHFKPMARVYKYAASACGVRPHAMMLVAAHPWDIHGAAKAGLGTGWVNRKGIAYPEVFKEPDVRAQSLAGVVGQLMGLKARSLEAPRSEDEAAERERHEREGREIRGRGGLGAEPRDAGRERAAEGAGAGAEPESLHRGVQDDRDVAGGHRDAFIEQRHGAGASAEEDRA